MHRCHAAAEAWGDAQIYLTRDEAHHLLDVLRVGDGEHVTVFDGRGREVESRVKLLSKGRDPHRVVLEPIREVIRRIPSMHVVLAQAIPKGTRMDWIVEKATELGAAEIMPLVTSRTVVRADKRQGAGKIERWQRIALSAARQCGTAWVPEISAVTSFDAFLAVAGELDLLFVGSLLPGARPVREVLRELPGRLHGRVGFLIGPEGDFTPEEAAGAVKAGAIPVSFGALTLRVETAAIYAMSILAYETEGVGVGSPKPGFD